MARRKARIPQGKKIQPAVKTLAFNLTNLSTGSPGESPGPVNEDTIDLSQCASLVNRRFYRQGLNWAVAGFTLYTPGPQTAPGASQGLGAVGLTGISKIPDTWIASNSWHKGFATWNKMNKDALDEADSVKAKFTDFKVFMDHVHHTAGVDDNLIPIDADGVAFDVGEWEMSKMVVPNSDNPGGVNNFEIVWTGANYPGGGASTLNAVSLIEGYAASRGLPDIRDPNVPGDAGDASGTTPENWMSATFNEGITQDDRVLDDLILENNQAPYPFENATVDGVTFTDTMYPGGANQAPGLEIVSSASVSTTTIGRRTELPGSNFQGGLIRVINQCTDDYKWRSSPVLLVHLVAGPHRGYMCQKMQDV